MKLYALISLHLLLALNCDSSHAQPHFPLRVSDDQRYLVDAQNRPFLVHGESSWEIVWMLTKEETSEYFAKRAAQGFNATLFNILPDSHDPHTKNRAGDEPFRNPLDFTTVNDAYFEHAEWVVAEVGRFGMAAFIFPCYLGIDDSWIDELHANGADQAAAYGKFLAERFGKYPNVVWILGGDRDPEYAKEEQLALARAIHQHDPHHLITFHGREHSSADLFHNEAWLGFNLTYNYAETYSQSHQDWHRIPVKPTLMGESGYEREANDWRYGTPQRMRRQLYWALLSGSCGHFYGTDFWDQKPGWRESLDWLGAHQMQIAKQFFDALPWQTLAPEFEKKLIVEGNGDYGSNDDYITAAATPDLSVAVLYMPVARHLGLDLSFYSGPVQARWFDPTTGVFQEAFQLDNKKYIQWGKRISPPVRDCDSDWVLVLEKP
ncbi:DUF4038 domain-containing protein [candidate division KSB1 bacterium]|nr:MAG: DUF4038 domain-containing protein [candidate division KSB1 bacterium]